MSRPGPQEAAKYYFTYIDRIPGEDIVSELRTQLQEIPAFLSGISEEKSRHRYSPEKWSVRQVLNHVADTERAFAFRALWFARGFNDPLPSFDQIIASNAARADEYPWASHLEDFRQVRGATISFFQNLPLEAWNRGGVASGNFVTVNALAYSIAGHLSHHTAIVRERYL